MKLDCKTNEYFFCKFNIAHKNHEVSEKAYISHLNSRKLNDLEVEKYVSDYIVGLKMPKDAVQEQIYKETGKLVTLKDLDNYKKRLINFKKKWKVKYYAKGGSTVNFRFLICSAITYVNEGQKHNLLFIIRIVFVHSFISE